MLTFIYKYIVFILLYAQSVKLISIKLPPHTRYDPCGLGVIHIDKVFAKSSHVWKAVISLGLYPELEEASIDIVFKEPVAMLTNTQTSLITSENDYAWNLKVTRGHPDESTYYILIDNETPIVEEFSVNGKVLCNDIKKARGIDSLVVSKSAEDPNYSHICGRQAMNNTELITTGTTARRGDWPWHVAITIRTQDAVLYQCGGNIISRTAVVTAGHCLYNDGSPIDTDEIKIYAGCTNLQSLNDEYTQARKALSVVFHPEFNSSEATYDLAVIKIAHLSFNEYVQPVCLWSSTFDKTQLYGKWGVTAGFGLSENDTYLFVLRSSDTIVQNDATCIAYATKYQKHYKNDLNEFTICAGNGPTVGNTPRNGDSGGGLTFSIMQKDNILSWFLRGVVSRCILQLNSTLCDPDAFVIYTDVAPHYKWLMQHAGL